MVEGAVHQAVHRPQRDERPCQRERHRIRDAELRRQQAPKAAAKRAPAKATKAAKAAKKAKAAPRKAAKRAKPAA